MLPKRRISTHPGKVLLEEFLKPLEMSTSQLAKHLGDWDEQKVEAFIKGDENLTEAVAQKFAILFDTTPELWIQLQRLFEAGKKHSHAKHKPDQS